MTVDCAGAPIDYKQFWELCGREGLLSTLGSWADLTQSFGLGSSRFQLIGGALWLSSSPTPESNVLL